jgi:hypothetical protein
MTYEQLITQFKTQWNTPTLQDAETRVFTVLTDFLRGTSVAGFGALVMQAFPATFLEDYNHYIYAHAELVLAPDDNVVAWMNATNPPPLFASVTTDAQRVLLIIADSLAKGEELPLEGYGIFSVQKMAAYMDNGVLFPAKRYPIFIRDSSHYRLPNPDDPPHDRAVFPVPGDTVNGVREWQFVMNGSWSVPYRGCLPRPFIPSVEEFNAAVQANVAAQTAALQTAYTNAQAQITSLHNHLAAAQAQIAPLQAQVITLQNQLAAATGTTTTVHNQLAAAQAALAAAEAQVASLQAQISQLQQGNVNLQQLEQQGTILMPKRRMGAYTIKNFTVLNAIYRTGNPPVFNKRDLDFIDVQMLSVQQAVRKMYQIGVAKQNDLNTSAIFRRRSNRLEEYSSKIEDDFVEYLFECVRIMNYCVDEIRFKQSFNLNTPTLLRIIEPKP